MKCQICHNPIVPDIPGLSPKILQVYEGEEFVVHERCGEAFVEQLNRQKDQEGVQSYLRKILKALSMVIVIEFLFIVSLHAEDKKPSMSCSKVHVSGIIRCYANDTQGYDIEWYTIAYGKIEYSDFGLQVELPIHAKYYTLIVMNITKEGEANKQSGIWARALPDGKVDYKAYVKGIDPNKDIPEPRVLQKACIVTIGGAEGNAYYEFVLVIGETADEYIILKEGMDKPVNFPKDRIVLAGEMKLIVSPDGRRKHCKCPSGVA